MDCGQESDAHGKSFLLYEQWKFHLNLEPWNHAVFFAVNIRKAEKWAVEKISMLGGNTFKDSYLVIVHKAGIIPYPSRQKTTVLSANLSSYRPARQN